MKALEITKHKTNLTNILIDIYKDSVLGSVLGFKGGTAAMLFYNLPRFSVDLDFDLISDYDKSSNETNRIISSMTNLLSSKYIIKDQSLKVNTLFWLVSYGQRLTNIKVEISTRKSKHNHYEKKSFYGVQLNVMDISDMIAHKMVAVMERSHIANRDLFDIHYFLGTPYASEINYDIIKERTGKSAEAFYEELLLFVDTIEPSTVLSGLGEVLDDNQKDWAKAKLVTEIKELIKRQIDVIKNGVIPVV